MHRNCYKSRELFITNNYISLIVYLFESFFYFCWNQCEALYIINSARNCISSRKRRGYHHCESIFDTHLKVWWYTALTDWWDTRATSRPWWYAIAFAMDKKIDLQKQVYFLVGESGFEPLKSLTTDLQSAPFGRSGIPPYGAGEGSRTPNLLITNQLLYQLSYTSAYRYTHKCLNNIS